MKHGHKIDALAVYRLFQANMRNEPKAIHGDIAMSVLLDVAPELHAEVKGTENDPTGCEDLTVFGRWLEKKMGRK